ncbi:hypothetical protein PFWH6_5703 [Pseudomonas fluorescens WH6]|nr:hypothetical protein PFWH6_5703 [Pseudomonas fluorescens WH6]
MVRSIFVTSRVGAAARDPIGNRLQISRHLTPRPQEKCP